MRFTENELAHAIRGCLMADTSMGFMRITGIEEAYPGQEFTCYIGPQRQRVRVVVHLEQEERT